MDIKNKKSIVISIIVILDMFVNIFNSVTTFEGEIGLLVVKGILLALCDMLLMFSIIELADKPVKSMLILTFAQVFTFVFELVDGATVNEAFSDMGILGIVVLIALAYHGVYAYKEANKDKVKQIGLKEKLLNTINYKRTIYSINFYARIVVYSMIASVILSTAGSETMELFNDNISFKLYSAIVLVIPALLVVGIITTSTLAYDLFIVKILLEIYTLYLLFSVGSFDVIQILYVVVEIIAITYAHLTAFGNKHSN